jgi:Protein of unknown function (DUF3617)
MDDEVGGARLCSDRRSGLNPITRAALALAVSMSTSAPAQDRVPAGQWQFTSQAENQQAAQSQIGSNFTNCIDPMRSVPVDPKISCRVHGMNRSGTAVTWSTTCTTEQGTFQSQGVAQYRGGAMSGRLTTEVPVLGGQVVQRISGRYLGPCKRKWFHASALPMVSVTPSKRRDDGFG